ncbi:MDR family MFS transporter [Noviherbaspirillum massiliense]|uniref:MDR family MFS transporter n=1 Tax=Noviherbaspirillum massiliense TaxID=1465823 RepID=UPI0002E2C7E0|nr:MDR family MFS transporter [Noviherbaspirillum massiliense]
MNTAAARLPALPINRPMITLAIMLATLIQTLDGTIANVALPHMQGSLSASQDEVTWILTSYIVAAAIATPLTGWFSDRFGVKKLLLASISGFTFASALCGLSQTLPEIVASRLLQGVFGAALVPLSQSILLEINPREKQGSAMAIWGMGVMVGPILGPTLGGWLTDSYNWRWVFFINVPIGLFAFFGVLAYLPDLGQRKKTRFDVFGFATLSIFIGALQAFLDRGEQLDWFNSNEIVVEAIVCFVAFVFFVAHTATIGKDSFFRYELLKDRNFITGCSFIFIIGAVMYATRALLPPMLQSLMGYPVTTTGLVTAPSGLGTMFAMLLVGRLVGRVDTRIMLLTGFGISAVALWQMSGYTIALTQSDIVIPGVVQGFGLGLVFVPLSAASFATLDSSLRPDGTAIYSLVRNIGSSIGISVVQTLATRNTAIAHASLTEHLTAYNAAGYSQFGTDNIVGLASINQEITRQAAMIAYVDDFMLMLGATIAIAPLILLIRPARQTGGEPVHAAMD